MQKITPFLWYDGDAEEAVNFYVSLFPNSRIVTTTRDAAGGPGPEGSVMTLAFELDGQRFTALNGGPQFKFNESVSFVVTCETQAEIDRYWDTILKHGGKEQACGWIKDRYGLCWQIVPSILPQLFSGDPEKAKRCMQAMMKMVKFDIEALNNA